MKERHFELNDNLAKELITVLSDPSFLTSDWKTSAIKELELTPETFDKYNNEINRMLRDYPYKFKTREDAVMAYKSSSLYDAHLYLFNRYKQVYEPNEAFYNELINTDDIKIYLSEMGRLPFHSFMIDVSKISFPKFHKDVDKIDSIYITPIWYQSKKANKHTLCIYILYVCGKSILPDVMYLHNEDIKGVDDKFNIYSNSKNEVIANYRESQHPYWKYNPENYKSIFLQKSVIYNNMDDVLTNDDIELIHRFIFQFLMYLASEDADIVETKYSIKQKSRTKRLNKNDKILSITTSIVGKRYGDLIEKYKENKKFYDKIRTISSSTKKPHMVRAHWHHYWKGSGDDKELILKWTHSYFTGNGEIDTVIHSTNAGNPKGSKGEQLVRGALNSKGIDFTEQFYIPETGKRYDFAVLINDRLCFIEFDGKQHFEPVKNWDFDKTVKSDIEKNEYAASHNIPLLRIKYDQITEIDKIIDDFIVQTK